MVELLAYRKPAFEILMERTQLSSPKAVPAHILRNNDGVLSSPPCYVISLIIIFVKMYLISQNESIYVIIHFLSHFY